MAWRDIVPSRRRSELAPRREPGDLFSTFQRRMNDLFEDVMGGSWLAPFRGGWGEASLAPQVDVAEDDKEICVTAELPGVDEKDLDLSLTHEALTIRGEKKHEAQEEGKDYYRRECAYGSFQRMIPLPAEVDESKVEAQYKKGILTVHLPKKGNGGAARKHIEVKAE